MRIRNIGLSSIFLFLMVGFIADSKNLSDKKADSAADVPQNVIAYCYQPLQNGIHQIYTINEDGSDNKKVIEASIGLNHHDCSPDGMKYAAVGYMESDNSTWSIHIFNADGTKLLRLTTQEGVWDSEPSWSPDGTQISFTRIYPNQNNKEELWLMNADGSKQHYIGIEAFVCKWSPDGKRFIYVARRTDNYDIYTCEIDGTNEKQLTSTSANESYPVYSPDGTKIAFCASTGVYNTPDNLRTYEIYIMNSDGSGLSRLTENDDFDYYPRWSPDGSRLVFSSDRHALGLWEVYVMDVDGTNVRRVTISPPNITAINPVYKPIPKSPYKDVLVVDHSDYDGDGKSDIAVFGPETGIWKIKGQPNIKFGKKNVIPVPGDYNGDDKTDMAYFSPEKSLWRVRRHFKVKGFGAVGDIPVPGDYNGDGMSDIAFFRPIDGTWYIHPRSTVVMNLNKIEWGRNGDIPVPGDYDGDGTTDIAVFRPSERKWYIRGNNKAIRHGKKDDKPVPADYNGDGKTDIAVWSPKTGKWNVRGLFKVKYGKQGNIPVPGDYNGDKKVDVAVYDPETGIWDVRKQFTIQYGKKDDIPLVRGK